MIDWATEREIVKMALNLFAALLEKRGTEQDKELLVQVQEIRKSYGCK